MIDIDNQEKGKVGEEIVKEELNNLREGNVLVLHNLIYKFPSILYIDGALTTQIDHLIITEKNVFCIETKYYEHLVKHDFSKMKWKTDYEKDLENPIWQNRKHKEILSSIFNILLEDIITIEVVIGSDITGYAATEEHPNDYICDEKSVCDLLRLLMVTDYSASYDFVTLKQKIIEDCLTYGLEGDELKKIEDEHVERLNFANAINTWMRRRERPVYHFGDVSFCEKCGRLLSFRKFNSLKEGNQNKSKDFLVGCTGYNTYSRNGCKSKPIYEFEKLKIMRFNVPNEEKQNMTMFEIAREKEVLEEKLLKCQKYILNLQNQVDEINSEVERIKKANNILELERKQLSKENEKYKKLVANIYYKKEK